MSSACLRRLAVGLLVAALSLGGADTASAEDPDWLSDLRTDRPRMFFNQETWPKVRDYLENEKSDFYNALFNRVRARPDEAPESWGDRSNPGYGPFAMEAALVWLMEGDSGSSRNNPGLEALEKAKNYLEAAVAFYHRQIDAGEAVNWYSTSRICALAAYDWIHDQLTLGEREHFVTEFIDHHKREMASGAGLNRLNRGGITGGFYGPVNLPWYIGVAFYGDGIDDDYALDRMIQGYNRHIDLLEYRALVAGDEGGAASVATGYAFQMYPWTEFIFMYTFNSATDGAIEAEYDHLSLFPYWVFWKRIPGVDGPRSYGLGDSGHSGNGFIGTTFLGMQMEQIAHFYADRYPERAAFALWLREGPLDTPDYDLYWWSLPPAFTYRTVDLPEPKGPDESWPLAKAFPTMGTVFMKSGWTSEDTHAVFVVDGEVNSHRHYDQGHFTIYHKGFQAIDAGTYGDRTRSTHLTEYFYRTVAHNSILIHAPAAYDQAPSVWGGTGQTLDGGQYQYGGDLAGFTTNPLYTYAANDMTEAYHPSKAEEVVRQLVFVKPDTFVVFDRVESTQANFDKTWLLQTASEPDFRDDGRTFRTEQNQGAMLTRTLLPDDADLVPVGGPGKEFWSAGQNWEPTTSSSFHELWGEWRMEVRPGASRTRDEFLHVLRVGDLDLQEMGDVELVEEGNRVGVRITRDDVDHVVTFNRTGAIQAWWGEQPRDPMGYWHGHEVDHQMNTDTNRYLGVIRVDQDPWVWVWRLSNWAYIDREGWSESGTWAWIPNPNPSSGESGADLWRGYPRDSADLVETGGFLGDITVSQDPWIWVWRASRWVYIGEDPLTSPGSWLWVAAAH